jgi:hypothetical protein
MRSSSLALVVALSAACSSLQPTVRPRATDNPGVRPGVGVAPGDQVRQPALDPTRPDVPSSAAHPTTVAQRRVCRSGAWPAGWIAVAYEAASGDECPQGASGRGDDARSVAVIVRYRDQPMNATLDVCGDQHVPSGWVDEHMDVDAGQCPGAASDGRSAAKRIRRTR